MMQPDAWDESCNWPRRLLHVPSMTSHLWEPGNTYGGRSDPSYNALSYTWGRWELNELDEHETDRLQVAGIDWRTPRIMPTHFTVDELGSTIKAASTESGGFSTDFLWIDIACIDQNPASKENASEIGRQAKLFKRAQRVYVWLQSFDTISFHAWLGYSLEHILIPYHHASLTSKACGRTLSSPVISHELLDDIERHIQRLADDPWCTSLWTLQEGFLRPDAFILTRTSPDPEMALPDLPHALDWIGHIIADAQRTGLAHNERISKIQKKCLELGFVGACHGSIGGIQEYQSTGPTENPFHLLACSNARQTSREEDRVYATMQVFDLRLGKSAPGETRTNFTIQELNQELEEALLAKYPVASQLVIQPRDCPLGKAWMVQLGGVVPTRGEGLWRAIHDGHSIVKALTKLSVLPCNGQRWGFFEGPLSSFSSLMDEFDIQAILDQRWTDKMANDTGSGDTAADKLSEPTWAASDRFIRPFPSSREILRQYCRAHSAVNSWIGHKFPNLQVALLGIEVSRAESDSLLVGVDGICINPLGVRMNLASFERIGTAGFTFKIPYNDSNLGAEHLVADHLVVAEAAIGRFTVLNEGLFG